MVSDIVGGSVIWLDDRTLLFSPIAGEKPVAHVYDSSLRRVDTLVGWNADSMAVASSVLYGLGFGQLRSAPISGHEVDDLRTFDADITSIVAVPPGPGPEIRIGSDVSPSPVREIASNDKSSSRTGGVWPIALVIAGLATAGGAWLLLRRARSGAHGG
jgi:hypothetical protein